jgi:hypothetical protein
MSINHNRETIIPFPEGTGLNCVESTLAFAISHIHVDGYNDLSLGISLEIAPSLRHKAALTILI